MKFGLIWQFSHYKELRFFSTTLNTFVFTHGQTKVLEVKNNFTRLRSMGLLLVVFLVDLEQVITQVISRNTGNQSQLIWIGGRLNIQ